MKALCTKYGEQKKPDVRSLSFSLCLLPKVLYIYSLSVGFSHHQTRRHINTQSVDHEERMISVQTFLCVIRRKQH